MSVKQQCKASDQASIGRILTSHCWRRSSTSSWKSSTLRSNAQNKHCVSAVLRGKARCAHTTSLSKRQPFAVGGHLPQSPRWTSSLKSLKTSVRYGYSLFVSTILGSLNKPGSRIRKSDTDQHPVTNKKHA